MAPWLYISNSSEFYSKYTFNNSSTVIHVWEVFFNRKLSKCLTRLKCNGFVFELFIVKYVSISFSFSSRLGPTQWSLSITKLSIHFFLSRKQTQRFSLNNCTKTGTKRSNKWILQRQIKIDIVVENWDYRQNWTHRFGEYLPQQYYMYHLLDKVFTFE